MRNYITAERAATWDVDATDKMLCESASAMVDHLTKGARFEVDDEGYPTGDLRDVFDAAACAQARWFVDNDLLSGDQVGTSASFMSLSLSGTGTRTTAQVMAQRVAPSTYEILSSHNLLFGAPGAAGWYW